MVSACGRFVTSYAHETCIITPPYCAEQRAGYRTLLLQRRDRGFQEEAGELLFMQTGQLNLQPGGQARKQQAVSTMNVNLSALVTDNVSELLLKILEFTHNRHKILAENINNLHSAGFVPKDLAVEEFADAMDVAIGEHEHSRRLMLRDTENVKFGYNGAFKAKPVVDKYAKQLFENDINGYLELQKKKLAENLLNYRVASKLLRQKQTVTRTANS